MVDPAVLSRIPLFAKLPEKEIANLSGRLVVLDLAPEQVVLRENEPGDRFYIVLSGDIEIIKSMGTTEERIIAVRSAGDFVGEMSLFERDHLRTASVRARHGVELLEMTHSEFDALLHRQPKIAYELVRELSTRLADAHNATIRDLREKNRELSQAYEELKAAHLQIVEKERLERELTVARQIQESILPRELPCLEGFEVGARIVPSRMVGGDLFDTIDLGGDRLGIAVADVSDKGVPAAIFMALARSLLRAESESERATTPGQVLKNVNRVLLEMNDAGMFVTVLYGVLERGRREFHFARAGHELPIVLDGNGMPALMQTGKGQPLGLFEEPLLDEQCIQLEQGGLLLCYTDGVTDQQDETGDFFGIDRLADAALHERRQSAQVVCDHLLEQVNAFKGAAVQTDDITFLAVRVVE